MWGIFRLLWKVLQNAKFGLVFPSSCSKYIYSKTKKEAEMKPESGSEPAVAGIQGRCWAGYVRMALIPVKDV